MPTIAEIYRALQEHEELQKTAAAKKVAIDSPQRGVGDPAAEVGAVLEDVLGQNVAETKVRIKKKLEEVSGQAQEVEGLNADADDEKPSDSQAPALGDKMPPAGDKGALVTPETAAAVIPPAPVAAAAPGGKLSSEEDKGEEKTAEEKLAAEYYAAGQIMANGFVSEMGRLMGSEEQK